MPCTPWHHCVLKMGVGVLLDEAGFDGGGPARDGKVLITLA